MFQGGTANYNEAIVSDATVGGLGTSTAVSGQLLLKGGTGASAYTFTSNAADATVGDLINDINTSGRRPHCLSRQQTGTWRLTDTKGRGVECHHPTAEQHQHAESRW